MTLSAHDRKTGLRLGISVLVLNLLIAAFLAVDLHQSRKVFEHEAEARSQNLALALTEYLNSNIRMINFGLGSVADQYWSHMNEGSDGKQHIEELLQLQHRNLPFTEAVRIADASGDIIHGAAPNQGTVNIGDREYFRTLQNDPEIGIVFSPPVLSRVSQHWVLVLAKRINTPDGQFAGIVYATIRQELLTDTFSRFALGSKGLVTVFRPDLQVIGGHPGFTVDHAARFALPDELARHIRAGDSTGTYFAERTYDHEKRTSTFSKVPDSPLFVMVGLAEADYLEEWHAIRQQALLLMAAFFVITSGLGLRAFRASRREAAALHLAEEAEQARQDADRRFHLMANSVVDYGMFLLDVDGRITTWNEGARRMKGYERDEVLGQSLEIFYTEKDRTEGRPAQLLKQALEEGGSKDSGWRVRKDGSRFYANTTITLLRDATGTPCGFAKITRDVTDLRNAEQALRESEQRLNVILDSLDAYIYLKDSEGRYLFVNKKVRDMWQRKMDDVVGRDDFAFFDAETAERLRSGDETTLRSGQISRVIEHAKLSADSPTTIFLTIKLPLRNETGEVYAICGLSTDITDITDIKRTEEQLRITSERLAMAASAGIVGVWDWDVTHNELFWDDVMFTLYGLEPGSVSDIYSAWLAAVHPDDRKALKKQLKEAVLTGKSFDPEFRVIWPDGSVHHLKSKGKTDLDENGRAVRLVGINYDQTEQKEIQRKLDQMAFYDRLTNLPNRRLLEDRLNQALSTCEREHQNLALLFIDLDKFKPVNDQYGHEAGDWLLQQVAVRMQACLRGGDTVARIGGDEFIVLLPSLAYPELALSVAEKIRKALEEPFPRADAETLRISCSIGVVLYPDHARNHDDLLRLGDAAMYRAKHGGRNAIALYAPIDPARYGVSQGIPDAEWTLAHSTGHADIDLEHREIFNQSQTLLDLVHTYPPPEREQVNEAIDVLMQLIEQHFNHEEELMRAFVPEKDLDAHAQQHRAVLEAGRTLRTLCAESYIPINHVAEFLVKNLVVDHMRDEHTHADEH